MEKQKQEIQTLKRKIDWLGDMVTGWGCGYIGIPKGHPWYGKEYADIEADVHGRLTYASFDNPSAKPKSTQDGLWWIGFDCAHGGDTPINCPEIYVDQQIEKLKQQAIKAYGTQ